MLSLSDRAQTRHRTEIEVWFILHIFFPFYFSSWNLLIFFFWHLNYSSDSCLVKSSQLAVKKNYLFLAVLGLLLCGLFPSCGVRLNPNSLKARDSLCASPHLCLGLHNFGAGNPFDSLHSCPLEWSCSPPKPRIMKFPIISRLQCPHVIRLSRLWVCRHFPLPDSRNCLLDHFWLILSWSQHFTTLMSARHASRPLSPALWFSLLCANCWACRRNKN